MTVAPIPRAFCLSRRPAHRQAAVRFLREATRIDTTGWRALLTAEAIVGWGHKRSFLHARLLARLLRVPYVRLEDGFLRSVGLGKDGAPAHSLVVDFHGIYYDARQPSDLELLLERGGWEDPALLARGAQALELLRRHRLTKYNVAPDLSAEQLGLADGRRRLLVIDQVRGDTSIPGALARGASFRAMLDSALAEHPDVEILVKLHPDVLAGKRRGHLDRIKAGTAGDRVRVLPRDVNPWSLFPLVERVYTVSSQTGLEALLAGRPVTCFGLPFYAGWGLTDDRLAHPSRTRHRSLVELFTATYLLYARYADPVGGTSRSFEETVGAIAAELRAAAPKPGLSRAP